MESPAREIAHRLAGNAEAVCRRYLPNGRREGRYWMVGDIHNSPGRSLYVRLTAYDGEARAGKWTDAASGDHGDLLDIIAAACGHSSLRETLAEARRFLSMPPDIAADTGPRPKRAAPGSTEAAGRLWSASRPIAGTAVRAYLVSRRIENAGDLPALRFHPRCYYRASDEDAAGIASVWPAMIAAVTDTDGSLKGVHRTWLAEKGAGKAPVVCPRRAMGQLLGNGVRFGLAGEVMAFGEGIETVLSLRELASELPLVAGLSAAHLAALVFPPVLRCLYVARDRDPAGLAAYASLAERAAAAGLAVYPLDPVGKDFNEDLVCTDADTLRRLLAVQLQPDHCERLFS